jgi:hypothetical protein
MFANGGPEQDKLLKEIYLGKLLERRRMLITDEIRTALDAYEIAGAKNNTVLQYGACMLLRHLCGPTYHLSVVQNAGPVAQGTQSWLN